MVFRPGCLYAAGVTGFQQCFLLFVFLLCRLGSLLCCLGLGVGQIDIRAYEVVDVAHRGVVPGGDRLSSVVEPCIEGTLNLVSAHFPNHIFTEDAAEDAGFHIAADVECSVTFEYVAYAGIVAQLFGIFNLLAHLLYCFAQLLYAFRALLYGLWLGKVQRIEGGDFVLHLLY